MVSVQRRDAHKYLHFNPKFNPCRPDRCARNVRADTESAFQRVPGCRGVRVSGGGATFRCAGATGLGSSVEPARYAKNHQNS